MNKGLMLAVSVVVIVAAAIIYDNKAVKWEKTLYTDTRVEEYDLKNTKSFYCTVTLYKNGDIIINAVDKNYNGQKDNIYDHHVVIREGRIEHELFAASDNISVDTDGYMHNTMHIISGNGYRVFYAKCAKPARKLPPHIRKKFNGCYGVN